MLPSDDHDTPNQYVVQVLFGVVALVNQGYLFSQYINGSNTNEMVLFAFLLLLGLAALGAFVRRQDLRTSTSFSYLSQGLGVAWFVASVLATTDTTTDAEKGTAWAAVGAGIAVVVGCSWEYSNRVYALHVQFDETRRLLAVSGDQLKHLKLRHATMQTPLRFQRLVPKQYT